MHAGNIDPTELNVNGIRQGRGQSANPELTGAFEELEAEIFDPVQEEDW